jgi:hypothetical protein
MTRLVLNSGIPGVVVVDQMGFGMMGITVEASIISELLTGMGIVVLALSISLMNTIDK